MLSSWRVGSVARQEPAARASRAHQEHTVIHPAISSSAGHHGATPGDATPPCKLQRPALLPAASVLSLAAPPACRSFPKHEV